MKKTIILIISLIICITLIIIVPKILSVFCSITGCNYIITNEYIKGRFSKIEEFQIAELDVEGVNENGMPYGETEIFRYLCSSTNNKFRKKLYFHKKNKGYLWNYFIPDFKYVEDDSLKDFTLEEKLALIREEDISSESKYYDTMPFEFEPGKWYCIFGLSNAEGVYYIYINADKSLDVKYHIGAF